MNDPFRDVSNLGIDKVLEYHRVEQCVQYAVSEDDPE